MVAHAAGREQVLDAEVQTRPVPCPSPLLVHCALPQRQSAGLDPSVFVQAGSVTVHRHSVEPEQDAVEEVALFKKRALLEDNL